MKDEQSSKRKLAVRIAKSATIAEGDALRVWIHQLLEVRRSALPMHRKAKQALAATLRGRVVWPAVKIAVRETKRVIWDDRGVKARFGLSGAAVGLVVFGGKNAGIAALGTAIGVPLWVVLGAGAAFAGVLYEELTRSRGKKDDGTERAGQVIDGEPDDGGADRPKRLSRND